MAVAVAVVVMPPMSTVGCLCCQYAVVKGLEAVGVPVGVGVLLFAGVRPVLLLAGLRMPPPSMSTGGKLVPSQPPRQPISLLLRCLSRPRRASE